MHITWSTRPTCYVLNGIASLCREFSMEEYAWASTFLNIKVSVMKNFIRVMVNCRWCNVRHILIHVYRFSWQQFNSREITKFISEQHYAPRNRGRAFFMLEIIFHIGCRLKAIRQVGLKLLWQINVRNFRSAMLELARAVLFQIYFTIFSLHCIRKKGKMRYRLYYVVFKGNAFFPWN